MRKEMAAALKVDDHQPAANEAPTGRIPVVTVQLVRPAAAGLLTVESEEEDDGLIGPKQKPTMTLARAPWRPAQLAALEGIRDAVHFSATGGRSIPEQLQRLEVQELLQQRRRDEDVNVARKRMKGAPPQPQPQPQPQPAPQTRRPLPPGAGTNF